MAERERSHPNPYRADEDAVRHEDDPRVQGVGKLIKKLKDKEIQE